MRWFSFLFFTIIITTAAFAWLFKNSIAPVKSTEKKITKTVTADAFASELLRLKKYGSVIKAYAEDHHYNTGYCFLADMKLPSGSNRFFVYDLKKDSILQAGLVANGYGNNSGSIHFSNVVGSNCTSLGKYKIGNSYYGRFGLAYKLYGLDAGNSNVFSRFIVLHSHECVPEKAVSPSGICMSQGCPTVAPSFLITLKDYLGKTQQPLLMYIFY